MLFDMGTDQRKILASSRSVIIGYKP